MGAILCRDETEQPSLWSSLQGESQGPPPLLLGQEGFGGPRGTGWFGGWSGGRPTEWREGVSGEGGVVPRWDAGRKENINTQVMTSNTLTTHMKQFTPSGANGRMFSFVSTREEKLQLLLCFQAQPRRTGRS